MQTCGAVSKACIPPCSPIKEAGLCTVILAWDGSSKVETFGWLRCDVARRHNRWHSIQLQIAWHVLVPYAHVVMPPAVLCYGHSMQVCM
jgi:hypothetical protein